MSCLGLCGTRLACAYAQLRGCNRGVLVELTAVLNGTTACFVTYQGAHFRFLMSTEQWKEYVLPCSMRSCCCGVQVVICDARPAVPPEMPDDYQLLMASCWSSGPDERPSVDMLLHCIELMVQDRQQGKE